MSLSQTYLMSVERVDDWEWEDDDVCDNTENVKHTEKTNKTEERDLQIKLLAECNGKGGKVS